MTRRDPEIADTDADEPMTLDPDRYLERIGLDPATVTASDRRTLERLQRAHITAVPFENLSIVGDPHGAYDGEEIELTVPALYEKLVARERGGYCFELNGLFTWLLRELGYDADRLAARVVGEDGADPPANHHTIAVQFDRRYVVDVGLGMPKLRRPLPLDGTPVETTDCWWRTVESDRPDEESLVQTRPDGTHDWEPRFLLTDEPRELQYFRATNDYLQSAPESTFTGALIVNRATPAGYLKCSDETLTRIEDDSRTERELTRGEWHAVLERQFGLSL